MNLEGSEAFAARGIVAGSAAARSAAIRPGGGAATDAVSPFSLASYAGRLIELSGGPASASLTFTFRLVREAQKEAEPVAWILGRGSSFFPPDAAAAGIDLEALVLIRLPDPAAPRAADILIRSGAFGLVVLDMRLGYGGDRVHVPMAVQTRLVGLARKHGTAILCLTEKRREDPSLGSLVSYRIEAVREHPRESRYALRLDVLKDKGCGAGRHHEELYRGVDGLY